MSRRGGPPAGSLARVLRSFAEGAVLGELWGPSPPEVIALHGWRRTHSDFRSVLGPGSGVGPCASAAIDLPGFGASPPPPEVWGSPEYAQLVARVVEELASETGGARPRPMVVLGHSFGGRVAVYLAASRPDLVRALVLTGAPLAKRDGPSRTPPAGFRAVRRLRRAHLVPEATLERARRRYGSADYLAAQGIMRQVLVRLLAERYDEQLSRIRCPMELVWGDDDTEAPLWIAERVASGVAGANLTVCHGAGHLTPLSVPEVLRRAVDRLLGAPCSTGSG